MDHLRAGTEFLGEKYLEIFFSKSSLKDQWN